MTINFVLNCNRTVVNGITRITLSHDHDLWFASVDLDTGKFIQTKIDRKLVSDFFNSLLTKKTNFDKFNWAKFNTLLQKAISQFRKSNKSTAEFVVRFNEHNFNSMNLIETIPSLTKSVVSMSNVPNAQPSLKSPSEILIESFEINKKLTPVLFDMIKFVVIPQSKMTIHIVKNIEMVDNHNVNVTIEVNGGDMKFSVPANAVKRLCAHVENIV